MTIKSLPGRIDSFRRSSRCYDLARLVDHGGATLRLVLTVVQVTHQVNRNNNHAIFEPH
jgi:hypothetical protein